MSNTPGAQAQASKHAGQKQTFRHRRVAVAFFLFIGVPVYLGIHKKVASALDARALLIRKELEEARRLREEAEKVLADYQRKLGDVVMEVDNITALAAKQAETLAAETRQSLKEYDRCPNHLCAAPGPATVAITLLISVNLYVSLFLSLSLSLSLSTAASARLPPSMSLSSSSLAFSDSAPFGQGRLLRGRELSVPPLYRLCLSSSSLAFSTSASF